MLTHILESHIGTLQFILDDLSHQWYWPQSPSSQSVSSYLKSSQFLLRIEEPSASWPGPPPSTKSHSEVWRQQQLREQHRHLIEFPFFSSDRKPLLQKKRHTDTKSKFWMTFTGFKLFFLLHFNVQEPSWAFLSLNEPPRASKSLLEPLTAFMTILRSFWNL